MLQNAYSLAKIGADTAENEQHFAEILPIGRRVADHGPPTRGRPGSGAPRIGEGSTSRGRESPAWLEQPDRYLLRRLTHGEGGVYLGIPTNRFSQISENKFLKTQILCRILMILQKYEMFRELPEIIH